MCIYLQNNNNQCEKLLNVQIINNLNQVIK